MSRFWRTGRGYGAGDKTVEQLSAPPAAVTRAGSASGYRLVDVVDVVLDQLRDYYAERNPGAVGHISAEQEWALKIGLITPEDWMEISDAVRTRTCVLVETAFQPRQRDNRASLPGDEVDQHSHAPTATGLARRARHQRQRSRRTGRDAAHRR